ncbi:MAG TPA: helix-turn-helix domain-containing protein [Pirellulales bacterium]|jgi:excisionase family DNA binding protein
MKTSETTNGVPNPKMVLIKANEVADLLGVSTRTLWRLLSEGRLPQPVRLGGNTRWRLPDIETWIANGCQALDRAGECQKPGGGN